MTQYETVEQVFREYEKIVEYWDQEWLKDRKKYPTEIFVNVNEPLKEGQQLVIQVRPTGDWADKRDYLELVNVRIDSLIIDKIVEISQEIKKPIFESIVYISHVLIWEQDRYFGCIHKLRKMFEGSNIDKEKWNGFDIFRPSNCASLLLYPVWKKKGYETKLQKIHFLQDDVRNILSANLTDNICKPLFISMLDDWNDYYERFLKHEEQLYGDIDEREYDKIPPVIIKDNTETIEAIVIEEKTETVSNEENNCFYLEGEYWNIAYQGKKSNYVNSKGFQYIYYLLQHPFPDNISASNLYNVIYKTHHQFNEDYSEMQHEERSKEGLENQNKKIIDPSKEVSIQN